MLRDWLPLFRLRPHWFIAVACAIALSPQPKISHAMLLVAFAYTVAAYGELANFVYDYPSDRKNPRMKKYAHITGKIKLSSVKKAMCAFLAGSLAAGAALIATKPSVLPLVLLAIHCAHSYSVPPLRLKRFWWGGTITYTLYSAIVLILSSFVLDASITTTGITALAFWLGSLSVWALTSIPDEKYDRQMGIKTPAIKFGISKCIILYFPLVLLSTLLSLLVIINSTKITYAGAPFIIPASIGILAYLRMKKGGTIIMTQTIRMGGLPYRYNLALITLYYFFIWSS